MSTLDKSHQEAVETVRELIKGIDVHNDLGRRSGIPSHEDSRG